MIFPPKVERWRPVVLAVAADLPVDLVLAIIEHESAGRPGAQSYTTTRCAVIPSSAGLERDCYARGLMQVIPPNVASWNETHSPPATLEQMMGRSTADGATQIALGASVLRSDLAWASTWTSDPEQLYKLALASYAWGHAQIDPLLEELAGEGRPTTFRELATRWPRLGQPKNRPLVYARQVYARAFRSTAGSSRPHIEKEIASGRKRSTSGAIWGTLVVAGILLAARN